MYIEPDCRRARGIGIDHALSFYNQNHEEASIQPMLKEIETCIRQATETTTKLTMIIMAGDFNRHHPMWCKDRVHHGAIELAEELVNFFQKHGLQSCLPRGTPTYWSMSHPGSHSTIDLTVTDTPGNLFRVVPPAGPQHRSQTSKSVRPRRLETDRRICPGSDVTTSTHPNQGRAR